MHVATRTENGDGRSTSNGWYASACKCATQQTWIKMYMQRLCLNMVSSHAVLCQADEPAAVPSLYRPPPFGVHPFDCLSTTIFCKSDIKDSMMLPLKFTGPFELLFPRAPYSWGAILIVCSTRVSPTYRHSRRTCSTTSKHRLPGSPMCSSTELADCRIYRSWGMRRFRGVHPFSASASKHQTVSAIHNLIFRGNSVVS